MKINHIALWVDNLDNMCRFYVQYFGAVSGEKYTNDKKGFSSYFLTFKDGDVRLEIMKRTDIVDEPVKRGLVKGMAHICRGTQNDR
jgi:lactoylglutathione lyase